MSFILGCICGALLTGAAMSQTAREKIVALWQKMTSKTA